MLAARSAAELDALLAIVPYPPSAAALRRLPESARWRELDARAPAHAGTVRSTVLGNRRHTLAVLGYLGADASAFERLSLAGRMLKEVAARSPQTLGLAAAGAAASARSALEALLAAALAHAFALPSFRAPLRGERGIRRIVLLSDESIDTRYAAAAARGTNLARWLTALPPNILDAHGYRRAITRLARENGLTLRWLDERALRRAGAHAFLAVAAGNAQRGAGIAQLKYRPARRRRGGRPDVALDRQGHPVRHRRGQPQDASLDARHAHRHGRQRGRARHARRAQRNCAPRSPRMPGSRSPRIASVRRPIGRRKWCARRTASPFRSFTPMPKGAWCSPIRSRSPPARGRE